MAIMNSHMNHRGIIIVKYLSLLSLGLSPTDGFDEAIADMISYGVEDLLNDIVKYARETDEAKKVLLTKLKFCLLY